MSAGRRPSGPNPSPPTRRRVRPTIREEPRVRYVQTLVIPRSPPERQGRPVEPVGGRGDRRDRAGSRIHPHDRCCAHDGEADDRGMQTPLGPIPITRGSSSGARSQSAPAPAGVKRQSVPSSASLTKAAPAVERERVRQQHRRGAGQPSLAAVPVDLPHPASCGIARDESPERLRLVGGETRPSGGMRRMSPWSFRAIPSGISARSVRARIVSTPPARGAPMRAPRRERSRRVPGRSRGPFEGVDRAGCRLTR